MNVVSYPPAPIPHYSHNYPGYPVQPAPVQQNIRLPSIQELIPDSYFNAKRPEVRQQHRQQPLHYHHHGQQPPKINTWPGATSPGAGLSGGAPPLMSPPVSQASSPVSVSPSSSVPPFHHLPSPPPQQQVSLTTCRYDPPRNPAKKRRGNLPRPVTDILRNWLHDHIQHPYPTEAEKNELMARTGLTLNQISNWFINARRRRLPALHKNREKQRMYSQH